MVSITVFSGLGYSALLYAGGVLFLLLFLAWLAVTLYLYLLHKRYSHIPSPRMPSFYLGHASMMMEVLRREGPNGEIYLKWCKECGLTYVFFIIHKPFLFSVNPDDIKELAKPKYKKPRFFYEYLANVFGQRFMGQGLVTVRDYDTWRKKRSIYDPAFKKSYLKGLIPSFNECVDQFLERLRPLADGKTQVPMKDEFATLALSIISKVAFGFDLNQEMWSDEFLGLKHTKGNKRLSWLLQHCMKGMMKGAMHPFFKYYGLRSEIESYRETARAIRIIGRECIKKRITAIENGEQVPNDILTSALKAAQAEGFIDLQDLEDDFTTFYVAGQETTSNLLSFTLIVLLQHPEILDRVLTEISDVLEDRTVVTDDDLEQLKYVEQVLLETMRLYQPVGGGVRETTEGLVLSGYEIPVGTIVMSSTYVACRLPENFDDPLTFNPSNFDRDRKPNPYVYSPFSVGHRSCLGKTFAMIEAKMIIARLLQSFHISLPKGYKLELIQRTTHTPKDNVPCTLEHRLL